MIRNARVQVLLAIVLGLVAAIFVWNYSRQMQGEVIAAKEQAAKPPVVQTTDVVVALQDIPARTLVTSDLFKVEQVPADRKLPQALTTIDETTGKVTTDPLAAGEQVIAMRLATAKQNLSLSQAIPAGYRAVAVAVTPLIAAGGLILPGDRIDIMVSYGKDVVGENVVTTLLQNVQVLAVADTFENENAPSAAPLPLLKTVAGDQSSTADTPVPTPSVVPTPGKPVSNAGAQTLTLAVTPDQAQQLLLAEQHGSLMLSLRSSDDNATPNLQSIVLTVVPGSALDVSTPTSSVTPVAAPVVAATPAPVASDTPTTVSAVVVTNVEIGPTSLRPGDTLRVAVTVKNTSNQTIHTQGPDPQFTYVQGQTYNSQSFPSMAGAYRIGLGLSGRPPVPYPYRWGLGADLPAGASTTVVGFVKITYDTTANTFWAGVIQEPATIVVDNAGPTLVTIAPAKVAVIAVDAVHMRSGPDVTSSIVETLPYGAQVTILGQQSDWYNVRVNGGKVGWVAAGWIVAVPNANPPIASNPPSTSGSTASTGSSTRFGFTVPATTTPAAKR